MEVLDEGVEVWVVLAHEGVDLVVGEGGGGDVAFVELNVEGDVVVGEAVAELGEEHAEVGGDAVLDSFALDRGDECGGVDATGECVAHGVGEELLGGISVDDGLPCCSEVVVAK